MADAGRARSLVPALVARRRARSSPASSTSSSLVEPADDQGPRRRSRRTPQGDAADEQAHVRKRLQEPARRDRSGTDARAVRPEGPSDRRRARLPQARELHRERGRCDERGLHRAHGRGAATRSRAVRRRARARGRLRGRDRAAGRSRRNGSDRGETGPMAGGRTSADRVGPRARQASSSRFREAWPMLVSISLASSPPAVPFSSRSRSCSRAAAGYWAAYATPIFAVERIDVRGAPPPVARDVARATRELVGTSLVAVDADGVEGKLRTLPSVAGVSVDRAFPHTLVVRIAPEKPVAVVRRGTHDVARHGFRQAHPRDRERNARWSSRASGSRRASPSAPAACCPRA